MAERKAGEMLKELERDQGGSGRFGSGNGAQTASKYKAALDGADVERRQANRWQAVASLPKGD